MWLGQLLLLVYLGLIVELHMRIGSTILVEGVLVLLKGLMVWSCLRLLRCNVLLEFIALRLY